MKELVEAHARLDEKMDAAIWIRTEDRVAWLVEVLPDMEHDAHPERPVSFNPGRTFRHPLHLVAGNLEDIEEAIRRSPDLARDILAGEVLCGSDVGEHLQRVAADVQHGAAS